MKICVILPCNIYNAPFYKRYEQILTDRNCSYDFISWNRACIQEQSLGKSISFNCFDEVNAGNVFKVTKYIRFAYFVKKKLKQTHYDKVIILGSYAGIMALLSGFLNKHYKYKYWLDIRDYTFENIKPYYWAMTKAINNSYATVISSRGYEKFLPKNKYIIAHNIDELNIKASITKHNKHVENEPIRISFIGLIRYFDENKKLLSALKNDNRFILQYYGANSETLKYYCSCEGIYNVDFYGRFEPEETSTFYGKTDIINNVYGNGDIALKTALSNKLYFSAALKIPILVSPGTYMNEITTRFGFGYTIDYNLNNFSDNLYNWYQNILISVDTPRYEEFLSIATLEDDIFVSKFKEFIVLKPY